MINLYITNSCMNNIHIVTHLFLIYQLDEHRTYLLVILTTSEMVLCELSKQVTDFFLM